MSQDLTFQKVTDPARVRLSIAELLKFKRQKFMLPFQGLVDNSDRTWFLRNVDAATEAGITESKFDQAPIHWITAEEVWLILSLVAEPRRSTLIHQVMPRFKMTDAEISSLPEFSSLASAYIKVRNCRGLKRGDLLGYISADTKSETLSIYDGNGLIPISSESKEPILPRQFKCPIPFPVRYFKRLTDREQELYVWPNLELPGLQFEYQAEPEPIEFILSTEILGFCGHVVLTCIYTPVVKLVIYCALKLESTPDLETLLKMLKAPETRFRAISSNSIYTILTSS